MFIFRSCWNQKNKKNRGTDNQESENQGYHIVRVIDFIETVDTLRTMFQLSLKALDQTQAQDQDQTQDRDQTHDQMNDQDTDRELEILERRKKFERFMEYQRPIVSNFCVKRWFFSQYVDEIYDKIYLMDMIQFNQYQGLRGLDETCCIGLSVKQYEYLMDLIDFFIQAAEKH
jgi:hypothetical protein